MTKVHAPQFPLAGGDYVRDANGLRQVAKPTAPPPGKSAQADADAKAAKAPATPAADPAPAK